MVRILLTEDDEAVRSFVRRVLEMDGYDVTVAQDGEEAIDRLKAENGKFDLLLTDIKMPIMDGIALALNVSQEWPEIVILMMTGFADQRERTCGLEEVVHDVVGKPFSLTDLRQAVIGAINCGVVKTDEVDVTGMRNVKKQLH